LVLIIQFIRFICGFLKRLDDMLKGDIENPVLLVSPENVQTESRDQSGRGQDQGSPKVEMIADFFWCSHWEGSLTARANVRVTRAQFDESTNLIVMNGTPDSISPVEDDERLVRFGPCVPGFAAAGARLR
jgi:hypothetical protein